MSGQSARGMIGPAISGELLCKRADPRGKLKSWASDHRNRHGRSELFPILPKVERHQAIATHDPDELRLWAVLSQQLEQVICEAQAHMFFDGADPERAIVPGQILDRGEAGIIVARGFFQGVSRGWKPPDGVQVQVLQRGAGNVNMSAMGWVETAPEQADPCPARSWWQVRSGSIRSHKSDGLRVRAGSGQSRAPHI